MVGVEVEVEVEVEVGVEVDVGVEVEARVGRVAGVGAHAASRSPAAMARLMDPFDRVAAIASSSEVFAGNVLGFRYAEGLHDLRSHPYLIFAALPALAALAVLDCGRGGTIDPPTPARAPSSATSAAPLLPPSASASPSRASRRPMIEVLPVVEGEPPLRARLLPGDTVVGACTRLLSRGLATPAGMTARCGPDDATGFHGPTSVRSWLTSTPVLLASADFTDPQIWYDEDTDPLHAHVVVDLMPASRERYEAFAKAHPKARIATVIDGVVENVSQAGTLGVQGRFFITPSVPVGAVSNEPIASSIGVAMGAKPR